MDKIAIQQIGGSLYIRLPAYFRHKLHLKTGDVYEFIPNADGSVLRLIKIDEEEPTAAKATVEQEAPVAAE
jgi:antitoxin component of MazEF toxin-antitoxin module